MHNGRNKSRKREPLYEEAEKILYKVTDSRIVKNWKSVGKPNELDVVRN